MKLIYFKNYVLFLNKFYFPFSLQSFFPDYWRENQWVQKTFLVLHFCVLFGIPVFSQVGTYTKIYNGSGSYGMAVEDPNSGNHVFVSRSKKFGDRVFQITDVGGVEVAPIYNSESQSDTSAKILRVFAESDGFWLVMDQEFWVDEDIRFRSVFEKFSWDFELIKSITTQDSLDLSVTSLAFRNDIGIQGLIYNRQRTEIDMYQVDFELGTVEVDTLEMLVGSTYLDKFPGVTPNADYSYSRVNSKLRGMLGDHYGNGFEVDFELGVVTEWQNELNHYPNFDLDYNHYVFFQDEKSSKHVGFSDFPLNPETDPFVDANDPEFGSLVYHLDSDLEIEGVYPLGDPEFIIDPFSVFLYDLKGASEVNSDTIEVFISSDRKNSNPKTNEKYPDGFFYKKFVLSTQETLDRRFLPISMVNAPDFDPNYFSHSHNGYYIDNGHIITHVDTQTGITTFEEGIYSIPIEDMPLYLGKEHSIEETILFSPNPVDDYLHIQGGIQGEYNLTDVTGKTYQRGLVNGKTELDVQELPRGMYVLQFVSDQGGSLSRKFVKN